MEFNCRKCGQKFDLYDIELCPECQKELVEICSEVYKLQPEKIRKIDQFGMKLDSILSQSAYISESFHGNAAAFFGGYDGVGLLSKFFGQRQVVLFELDTRVLSWWQHIGKEYDFEVLTYQYDALQSVPDEFINSGKDDKIDCWRTDPPFNCSGMLCFLNRILYLNTNGAPIYLVIPYGPKWARLLKHNIFQLLRDNKIRIIGVSSDKYEYLDKDAPDSFIYKMKASPPILGNSNFPFEIKGATYDFSESPFGCHQYSRCKKWRDEWDNEIQKEKFFK